MSARRIGFEQVFGILSEIHRHGHDVVDRMCHLIQNARRRWYLYTSDDRRWIGSPAGRDGDAVVLVEIPTELWIGRDGKTWMLTWETGFDRFLEEQDRLRGQVAARETPPDVGGLPTKKA